MYTRFVQYMTDNGIAALLQEKGAVLAGYSGGADSTLLLCYLQKYCTSRQIRLYAAHVHHGIRGEEADRDEQHCRLTAEKMGIPLYVTHVDIPKLAAERSVGIEECARTERYTWFDKVCRMLGQPDMPVATAHNADDQMETVLFHMLRGSGLSGMTGIRPIRDHRFVRPLLSCGSDAIRQCCANEGYAYVVDSTNEDIAYARNYIRHEVLPRLQALAPHPAESVTRMTALLSRDHDFLEAEAMRCLEKTRRPDTEELDREALRTLHPAIATRVLRMAIDRITPGHSMTKEQTEQLLHMAADPEKRMRYLTLPGNVTAEIHAETVLFTVSKRKNEPTENTDNKQPEPLYISCISPDETVILDWKDRKIVLSRKNVPSYPENLENIYNLSIQRSINFDKIKGVLCLRTRKPGDTIRYKGMRRKVRKLQNEYHTPPEMRENMMILADEEEILWVEGWDVCDKAKISALPCDTLWIAVWEKTACTNSSVSLE